MNNFDLMLKMFAALASYYEDIGGSCLIIEIEGTAPQWIIDDKEKSKWLADKVIVAHDSELTYIVGVRLTDGKICILKSDGNEFTIDTRVDFDRFMIGNEKAWLFLGRYNLIYPIKLTIDNYWNELS